MTEIVKQPPVTSFGDPSPEPVSARETVNRMVEEGLFDDVLGRVDDGNLQLTGEGGFLPEIVRAVLERGLQTELSDHLGYEKGDPAGRGSPNSRNGSTAKTIATEVGDVELATPRDRNGTYVPRHQHLPGLGSPHHHTAATVQIDPHKLLSCVP